MKSYYNLDELKNLGLKSFGSEVYISRKVSFYGTSRISIGNNVRIDDFCVLSAGAAGIEIGNFVHIAVGTSIQGQEAIRVDDFVGISAKVSIFSSTDDYFGSYMSNPTVPEQYTNASHAEVHLCKHVLIGAGAVILPGVTMGQGSVLGALSLAREDCEEFYIHTGNPAKKIMRRGKKILQLGKDLMTSK